MAIVFGKRSSYLWNKAWGALVILALLMVLIIMLSVLAPVITKTGFVGLVAVLLFMYIILFTIEKRKKSINSLINGIEGEWQIVEELEKLPDQYVVLRGLKVKDRLDVDCTVVGPTGVFAIEVKSHKGKIGFDGQELTRNGRRLEKDFLRQVSIEAVLLREKIRRLAKVDLFVDALLVFSNKYASVHFGTQNIRGCRVIGRGWINEVLESGTGTMLDADNVYKIVSALAAEIVDKNKDKKLQALTPMT